MDPATQSTLIIIAGIGAQLAILIAAVFAGLTALSAKRIATDTKFETREQTAKIDTIVTDTAVVLGHVNSEKTAGEGREATLKRENELLREMLTEKKATAALLAQAAATGRTSPARSSDASAPTVPVPVEVVNQPLTVQSEPEKQP